MLEPIQVELAPLLVVDHAGVGVTRYAPGLRDELPALDGVGCRGMTAVPVKIRRGVQHHRVAGPVHSKPAVLPDPWRAQHPTAEAEGAVLVLFHPLLVVRAGAHHALEHDWIAVIHQQLLADAAHAFLVGMERVADGSGCTVHQALLPHAVPKDAQRLLDLPVPVAR